MNKQKQRLKDFSFIVNWINIIKLGENYGIPPCKNENFFVEDGRQFRVGKADERKVDTVIHSLSRGDNYFIVIITINELRKDLSWLTWVPTDGDTKRCSKRLRGRTRWCEWVGAQTLRWIRTLRGCCGSRGLSSLFASSRLCSRSTRRLGLGGSV